MGSCHCALRESGPSLRARRIMAVGKYITLVVLVCLSVTVTALSVQKREALSDGDAESIPAFYGFYGSPMYRPYGFPTFGWGSAGFGYNSIVVPTPNIYGGYI